MTAVPKKFLIAVHGIGEQLRGETIRSVAHQLCDYCEIPATMPLGRFGAEITSIDGGGAGGAFVVKSPPDHSKLSKDIGFGEIYWADIPRGPAGYRYSLDEAKKWAQSVAERARVHSKDPATERASAVIGEMAEGIRVLERIFFLADKAGFFRFNLRDILVDYLGDVQVVTEFKNFREKILNTFDKVMTDIHAKNKGAEFYLVAHSEGSVVVFLGLLHALQKRHSPGAAGDAAGTHWIDSVRGLMTIGSPIGKHLYLWPWLWEGLENPWKGTPCPVKGVVPIQWRNYYDFGDPIGFDIQSAKEWLLKSGWDASIFSFGTEGKTDSVGDFGFTRYYLPGKAHTDYWNDAGVFGHFFEAVVKPPKPSPLTPPTTTPTARTYPRTRFCPVLLSRIVPFLGAFLFLLAGVLLFHQAVVKWHGIDESPCDAAWDVFGVTLLMTGITVAARLPRVTTSLFLQLVAFGLFVGSLFLFPIIVSEGLQNRIGGIFILLNKLNLSPSNLVIGLVSFTIVLALILMILKPSLRATSAVIVLLALIAAVALLYLQDIKVTSTYAILVLASFFVIVVGFLSMIWPTLNAKPLVIIGTLLLLALVLGSPIKGGPVDQFNEIKEKLQETGMKGKELDKTSSELLNQLANQKKEDADVDKVVKKRIEQMPRTQPKKLAPVEKEETDRNAPPPLGSVWPVILSGAFFLYLWWASAILLDLAVIWHHYIRGDALEPILKQIGKKEHAAQTSAGS